MKKINAVDVLAMSIAERILFAEDVWDTIAATPDEVPLTETQRIELDRRLDEYHRNPGAGSPWSEVKQRVLGL